MAWSTLPSLPAARYEGAACRLGDALLFGGGRPVSGTPSSSVWSYDLTTKAWTALAPLPFAVQGQIMEAAGGFAFSAFGSQPDNTDQVRRGFRYDPTANTWTAIADAPTPARREPGAGMIDGLLYVAGGRSGFSDGGPRYADLDRYDPATDTWASLAPLLHPVSDVGATAFGGKLYVFAGTTDGAAARTYTQIYDPATDSWSLGTPVPTARFECQAAPHNGQIYVAGGRSGIGGTVLSTVEVYNPATDDWRSLPDMNTARANPGVASTDLGVHVIGGIRGVSDTSATTAVHEVFTEAGGWKIGRVGIG